MNETSGNKKIIYLCDPKKNKGCKKIACQDLCICTLKKECAVLDENSEPIVKYVYAKEQEKE